MAFFDLILLLILAGFVIFGIWFGLIHTLGSLVGVVAGAYLAGQYYTTVASWGAFIWGDGNGGNVIAFMIILVLVNRLVGLLFYVLDRAFEFIAVIPFLKSINRLAGGIFGLVEGAITIGLVIFMLARYPIGGWLADQLAASTVASRLVNFINFLTPLLPEALNTVKTWF